MLTATNRHVQYEVAMFLIAAFLLSLAGMLQASDEFTAPVSLSRKTITITFEGDVNGDYPIEIIPLFATLKNMVDDLGADQGMPLSNVQKQVFDALLGLITEKHKDGVRFINTERSLSELRRTLSEKFAGTNALALLLAANYLDIDKKLINVIASFYADLLKTMPYPKTNGIPADVEPFIAGWLLHDLLEKEKPVTEKRNFEFSGNVVLGPFFSNTGSKNGFACIWKQTGGSFIKSGLLSSRYVYFDFSKKDRFQEKMMYPSMEYLLSIYGTSQCILSEDGRYMLFLFGNVPSKIALYDLLNPKENKDKYIEPIQVLELPHPKHEIVTLLFDEKTSMFNIIACATGTTGDTTVTKTFYLYKAFPTPTSLTLSEPQKVDISNQNKTTFDADSMDWSYVNGQLIGVSRGNNLKMSPILYKNKKLYECSLDQENDVWFYTEDGKKIILDFCVITVPVNLSGETDIYSRPIAIQNIFFPNFQSLLQKKLAYQGGSYRSMFDAIHFCRYFLIKGTKENAAGIYYPWHPTLIRAIKILDKRMARNQKQVLIDAYFLYHYHTNNKKWRTYCKDIMQGISEEIKQIYKIDAEAKIEEPKTTKSWWDFSRFSSKED
jgi:hypothetical protein